MCGECNWPIIEIQEPILDEPEEQQVKQMDYTYFTTILQ